MKKVIILANETRIRHILPHINELRRLGHNATLQFNDIYNNLIFKENEVNEVNDVSKISENELNKENEVNDVSEMNGYKEKEEKEKEKKEEEDCIIIIPHSEDNSYIDGSWGDEDKPNDIKYLKLSQIKSLIDGESYDNQTIDDNNNDNNNNSNNENKDEKKKKKKNTVILIHNEHLPIDPEIKKLGIYIENSYSDAINRIMFDRINSNEIQVGDMKSILGIDSNNNTNNTNNDNNNTGIPHPPLKMVHRIVFVRHAHRLDSVMDEWSSIAERPQDTPLSSLGIKQSRCLGEWIKKQKWCNDISCMYASPFARTVQTSHYAIEMINNNSTADDLISIPINVEYGLCEGGPWMSNNNVCRTPWYLKAADLYCLSPSINLSYKAVKTPVFVEGPIYPGRPIETELWYDRCAQTIWRLATSPSSFKSQDNNNGSYDNDTIVIVTHAGCIGLCLHSMCGIRIPMIGNTAYTSIVWNHEEGKYVVENDEEGNEIFVRYDHLSEDEITGREVPVK